MPTLGQRLISNLGPDWRALVDIEGVLQVEAIANHHLRRRSETGTLDRTALDADIEQAVGVHRAAILEHLLDAMSVHLARSPFFTREKRAEDPVALTSLFESERLPVGSDFFDQRFVNYLSGRPELLKEVNWRQFEGLTAEWLARNGYKVELGPGRGDGGVDVRAWNAGADPKQKRPARKRGAS